MDIRQHIREVPDFPKPGILFYDISTLLMHPGAWQHTVRQMADAIAPHKPDLLAGIESRGFLVSAPLALMLGCGFIMLRKKGKLPGATVRHEYDLEYGSDVIEIQEGAVQPGQKVVLVDDLLATGGTLAAAAELIRKVGGQVPAAACIVELTFLNGRDKLDMPVT
ncbi:MAG: adenine phosphoribosyltransferase, partial [Oceanibaculum sp.]